MESVTIGILITVIISLIASLAGALSRIKAFRSLCCSSECIEPQTPQAAAPSEENTLRNIHIDETAMQTIRVSVTPPNIPKPSSVISLMSVNDHPEQLFPSQSPRPARKLPQHPHNQSQLHPATHA